MKRATSNNEERNNKVDDEQIKYTKKQLPIEEDSDEKSDDEENDDEESDEGESDHEDSKKKPYEDEQKMNANIQLEMITGHATFAVSAN